jgi:predicted transport protein
MNVSIIKSRIADLKARNGSEPQTKAYLIEPFFVTLGWDFSNPDEVIPEDSDSAGGKPDYSFHTKPVNTAKAKFFVEAKAISNPLTDPKMISEKLNYCSNADVPFLILTNGEIYKVYYIELRGARENKLLFDFNISDKYDDDEVSMLSKEAIKKDSLLLYARKIFIYSNVKTAIEKLFHTQPKKIVDVVNNLIKDCLGHKLGDDEIKEALEHMVVKIDEENLEPESKKTEPESWTVAHQFKDGRWDSTQKLYQDMLQEAKKAGMNFEEKPAKPYIGWVESNKDNGVSNNFCQINGQKSGLKIWVKLNSDMSDLTEQEKLKVRDVSKIGHWGMGDIEFNLGSVKDFEWAINIIKKAYLKA